jgi:hypothetical protein
MSKVVVGVMGPGSSASPDAVSFAFELGRLIALEGWVLLTGGRNEGVMDAACKGAKKAGGLTVGVLPTTNEDGMSDAVDIPILTGIGQARNNINVLSSQVLFACGMGAGTASEIALAIKKGKPVVLVSCNREAAAFFQTLGSENLFFADDPVQAVAIARKLIDD